MNNSVLDQILESISILDIISKKVKLQKKGREYLGCCPFHMEKTPSFYVNPAKGLYYCFGCGAKGNAFSFYRDSYNLSSREAIEDLAKLANIELPKNFTASYLEKSDKLASFFDLTKAVSNHWQKELLSSPSALRYLKGRNLTDETIQKFNLGWAASNNNFGHILGDQSFKEEDLVELGIQGVNDNGSTYNFFRNRVIFPIHNKRGQIVAFGGRTLENIQPKYLNSKESTIFDKKKVLYGLYQSYPNIDKKNPIIIVEGYLDVISLHQKGFDTAVACMGTSIGGEVLSNITSICNKPVFCLDGDKAGRKSYDRIINEYLPILRPGIAPKFILLKEGDDPDTYINNNSVEDFQTLIDESISLSDLMWLFETQGKELRTPEVRTEVMHNLTEKCNNINDIILRKSFISFFKNNFYNNYTYGNKYDNSLYSNNIEKTEKAESECVLISCMFMYPNLYEIKEELEEEILSFSFKNNILDNIKQELLYIITSYNPKTQKDLESFLDQDILNEINKIVANNSIKPWISSLSNEVDAKNLFISTCLSIKRKISQEEIKKINNAIKEIYKKESSEENTSKINILMKRKKHLSEELKNLV